MKMSKQRYNLLKEAFRACVDFFGKNKIRSLYADQTMPEARINWMLHNKVVDNLQYGDNHPFFQNGTWERFTPHIEGFKMYDDNGTQLNDNHIDTAIRRIVRELGLIEQ